MTFACSSMVYSLEYTHRFMKHTHTHTHIPRVHRMYFSFNACAFVCILVYLERKVTLSYAVRFLNLLNTLFYTWKSKQHSTSHITHTHTKTETYTRRHALLYTSKRTASNITHDIYSCPNICTRERTHTYTNKHIRTLFLLLVCFSFSRNTLQLIEIKEKATKKQNHCF